MKEENLDINVGYSTVSRLASCFTGEVVSFSKTSQCCVGKRSVFIETRKRCVNTLCGENVEILM